MTDKILAAYERRAVCLHRTWASTKARHQAVTEDHAKYLLINRAALLTGRIDKMAGRNHSKRILHEALLGSDCEQSY